MERNSINKVKLKLIKANFSVDLKTQFGGNLRGGETNIKQVIISSIQSML